MLISLEWYEQQPPLYPSLSTLSDKPNFNFLDHLLSFYFWIQYISWYCALIVMLLFSIMMKTGDVAYQWDCSYPASIHINAPQIPMNSIFSVCIWWYMGVVKMCCNDKLEPGNW